MTELPKICGRVHGRDAVCSLILGSPPGKVYTKLRTIGARLSEKF